MKDKKRRLLQKRMQRFDYSDNILIELNTQNLSNFYERSKKEIEDFWDVFHFDKEIDEVILDEQYAEIPHPMRTVF